MARDFARHIYKSKQWERSRELCMRLHQGLCARCLAQGRYTPAEIVHHKVHIGPENVDNPAVAFAQENLEPLCRKCHALEHPEIYGRADRAEAPARYGFDEFGNLVDLEEHDT